jgi:hypothetical protein
LEDVELLSRLRRAADISMPSMKYRLVLFHCKFVVWILTHGKL